MKRSRSGFPVFFRSAIGVLAILGLAGCQSSRGLKVQETPRTLLYSYVIANGMARGRIMTEDLPPTQVFNIITTDRNALLAILAFRDKPTRRRLRKAGQKVEDFIGAVEQPTQPLSPALSGAILLPPPPTSGFMR
ncbi:hypothetical protein [Acetobacter sp. AAB5]|uniref:hypothetical protein n=1 Tax=Acetobacter sp. AAB5 TaxID=3418370 RepID=UPI003CE79D23